MATIEYLHHAGICIELDGVSLLVDPHCQTEYPLWENTPTSLLDGLLQRQPPDILLITHIHSDHFILDATLRLLWKFPDLRIVAPGNVLELLTVQSDASVPSRLFSSDAVLGEQDRLSLCGLTITLYHTEHDGPAEFQTEHFSYLIRGSRSLFIAGDARPVAKNFGFPDINGIDVLIAPFPFLTLSTARKVVDRYLAPRQLVYLHLPKAEGDGLMYRNAIDNCARRLREQGTQVDVFQRTGQIVYL